jgi:hypothetical protein
MAGRNRPHHWSSNTALATASRAGSHAAPPPNYGPISPVLCCLCPHMASTLCACKRSSQIRCGDPRFSPPTRGGVNSNTLFCPASTHSDDLKTGFCPRAKLPPPKRPVVGGEARQRHGRCCSRHPHPRSKVRIPGLTSALQSQPPPVVTTCRYTSRLNLPPRGGTVVDRCRGTATRARAGRMTPTAQPPLSNCPSPGTVSCPEPFKEPLATAWRPRLGRAGLAKPLLAAQPPANRA